MAFPTNPVDNELYSNALGTQYKYVLADTAWKIVSQAGNGVVGTGTADYLPAWTDASTLSNSNLKMVDNTRGGYVYNDVTCEGGCFIASDGQSYFGEVLTTNDMSSIQGRFVSTQGQSEFYSVLAQDDIASTAGGFSALAAGSEFESVIVTNDVSSTSGRFISTNGQSKFHEALVSTGVAEGNATMGVYCGDSSAFSRSGIGNNTGSAEMVLGSFGSDYHSSTGPDSSDIANNCLIQVSGVDFCQIDQVYPNSSICFSYRGTTKLCIKNEGVGVNTRNIEYPFQIGYSNGIGFSTSSNPTAPIGPGCVIFWNGTNLVAKNYSDQTSILTTTWLP